MASLDKKMKGLSVGDVAKKKVVRKKKKSSTGSTDSAKSKAATKAGKQKLRRRLSIVGGAADSLLAHIDGSIVNVPGGEQQTVVKEKLRGRRASTTNIVYSTFASLSKVGFVPFNNSKVNQDRAKEIVKWGGPGMNRAFFGVMDGHGSLGHQVSQWVSTNLPNYCLNSIDKERDGDDKLPVYDPDAITTKEEKNRTIVAIQEAFVACNNDLAKGSIDCTFSGTTVCVAISIGNVLYSANAGDSRAVLAQKDDDGKLKAVPLTDDQKPEREDEAKRIEANNGRVDACKGMDGEDIGPKRVWLRTQDVPGLAMTRSFGDLIAASVGVIAHPEVWTHTIQTNDQFMILASDGVWEFISSQEACDLIAHCETPEESCRVLVKEATQRWQMEEEVIDDITALVVYFPDSDLAQKQEAKSKQLQAMMSGNSPAAAAAAQN